MDNIDFVAINQDHTKFTWYIFCCNFIQITGKWGTSIFSCNKKTTKNQAVVAVTGTVNDSFEGLFLSSKEESFEST